MSLGLERAGMTTRWMVENDPFCRQILEKHWPDVPKYGDIKELDFNELPPVDLLCGGFPCQPVSVAGKQLAQEDPRWLWPEFARAIRVLQPRWVLVENVPGLMSKGFGDVANDLASCGYDFEWDRIPAAAFGAPHLRFRVIIVAQVGHVADPNPIGRSGWPGILGPGGGTELADCGWWTPEPDICRVSDGVPNRLDRLKSLGNAVVPQQIEWIGRRIVAADQAWMSR